MSIIKSFFFENSGSVSAEKTFVGSWITAVVLGIASVLGFVSQVYAEGASCTAFCHGGSYTLACPDGYNYCGTGCSTTGYIHYCCTDLPCPSGGGS